MERKNVLLVGSNGGMGRAIATTLLQNNFNVFGLDISDESLIDNITYFKCDIRDEKSIKEVYKKISSQIKELYSIVDAAGIYNMDSLLEISDEDLKRIIDINVLGIQRINKIFFSLLNEGSKLVIITSELATLDPLPFNGIYSMSKALLEKYAFSLRMEVNNFGIKVITVRPGAVKTNLIKDSTNALDKMCEKTVIHRNTSEKLRKIVNSVESKTIEPSKIGKLILKILNKKNPKFNYTINANLGLKLLNALPDKLQVKIISSLLK